VWSTGGQEVAAGDRDDDAEPICREHSEPPQISIVTSPWNTGPVSERNGLSQLGDELIGRIAAMGEKKPKQQTKNWIKVLVVIACVLFVVLMVVSAMGSGWLSFFSVIRPGDTVTIDYTIRDRNGAPLVTTDQQVYKQGAESGSGIFFSKQLVVQANQSSSKAVIPIQVYSANSGWSKTFALFGGEFETITKNIIGMKQNEQKVISIPFRDSMTQTWSGAQLQSNGLNVTEVHIGDQIAMGVSDSPELEKNTNASSYSIRIGEVTKKSADGISIDFGYPSIEVRIVSITKV
jgi:hypothetical protein